MTNNLSTGNFRMQIIFIIVAIGIVVWTIWPRIVPFIAKFALLGDVRAEDEANYQPNFYQTAVAGWQAYEGNEILAEITYYTNRPQETSGDPNIMSSGEKVFEGAIACPDYLDFGAKVEIEDWEYICHDRMNQRYRAGDYFDIFTFNLKEAIQKGREIKIVRLVD